MSFSISLSPARKQVASISEAVVEKHKKHNHSTAFLWLIFFLISWEISFFQWKMPQTLHKLMVMEMGPQENNLDWRRWEICQEAQINLTAGEDALDIISLVTSVLVLCWNKLFPSLSFAMCLIIIVNINLVCSLSSLMAFFSSCHFIWLLLLEFCFPWCQILINCQCLFLE